MKNLKEKISDLKNEIKQRIIDGDFEVVKIEDNSSPSYYSVINILIEGMGFRFSVHKSKTYLSQHAGPVIIDWNGYEVGDLKHLYEPIEAMQLEFKQKKIKELEDEIRALQAK